MIRTEVGADRDGLRFLILALVGFLLLGFCLWTATARAQGLEITGFSAPALNQDASPSTLAGAHPFELSNRFSLSTMINRESRTPLPTENIKDLSFDLPPGVVGNAASFPACPMAVFGSGGACPVASQIGLAHSKVLFGGGVTTIPTPVYNLEPRPGEPARLGFYVTASAVVVKFHVRTGTDYGVTATIDNLSTSAPVFASDVDIWGVPADPAHDGDRGGASYPGNEVRPFLSDPTSCAGPLVNKMMGTTWQNPTTILFSARREALAPAMRGCAGVPFAPSLEAKATTDVADSPSGFDFHLHVPQSQDPDGPATAHLRESKVELPAGLSVNASSANGLGACSVEQVGYIGGLDEQQILSYDPRTAASIEFTFQGHSTASISPQASVEDVTAALESLPGLTHNVDVEGSPGTWIVAFGGSLSGTEVPLLGGVVEDAAAQTLAVTGEGGGYNLELGGADTAGSFEATFGAGATSFIPTENATVPLTPGTPIEGPGIALGTTIVSAFGPFITLDQPTTEAETAARLKTGLPFDTSAETLELALGRFPAIGEGNVSVQSTGVGTDSRTFEVTFGGKLAGTTPALLGSTAFLTGPGAGVSATAVPAGTRPLDVVESEKAGTAHFTAAPATCPPASEIGTVEISSPAVIDHPLKGSVYLATPHENPFNSLLAMYIAVDDPQSGVVVKLPGLIEADPATGQLTATVSEAPQLPFEDLNLDFFKGDAAPLKTGIACGTYEVKTDMVPWTAPEGETKHPGSSFPIDHGCYPSEAQAPNTPSFEAGTVDPSAGRYSPFVLKLSRADGTRQLTGIDAMLPKGLLARLAGTPYCSDQALGAAARKTGKEEQASPSCPAASRVGSVTVGAGAGGHPFYAPGSAYLAGPYKGAPLSLAVVTPAVAGPFDLGTVVVRNALYVDPTTAQVHAVSDPFPHILQGIPLDIRSISLTLDKPNFTKNPTNCSPFAITGAALALTGQSASLNQPFQAANCSALGFRPSLSLRLKGQVRRTGNPAVDAVLKAPEGQANIAATTVILPRSEFIDQAHVSNPCTRVQFNENACPAKSILGTAVAYSPLLEKPLEGPVYFRSNGGERELPDLVADLDGQLHVVLVGFIDSVHKKGSETSRVRTRFASVPDAPVSKFELHLYGGKRGLLENSKDLCKGVGPANVQMDGQNGKTNDFEQKLATSCGSKKKGKAQHAGKKKAKAGHGGGKKSK